MELEKGDIVAVYGKMDLISLSIEFITRSPISHVALVVDSKKKELIEANMNRKIGYRLLDDYRHHCVILRVPSFEKLENAK